MSVEPPEEAGRAPADPAVGHELRSARASGKVVRGGVLRTAGYVVGTLANVAGSVVLLRYLGVERFGSYAAVTSLVAIAGGLADGGLTAVANRELAVVETTAERRALTSRLMGIRLLLTPTAIAVAVLFAIVAGYPSDLVVGTLLAGIGWTCVAASAALAMPLSVDLRIGAVTMLDVIKQAGSTVVVVLLVLAGAGLLPFFAATIPAAALALALTPVLLAKGALGLPTIRFKELGDLVRRSLPIALATVLGAVYLRMLTVLVYQLGTDAEAGLFGTSARVIEAISGLPLMAFLVALPVMSLGYREDRARMERVFQRMVEVGSLLSLLLVTGLVLGARPVILAVGGESYLAAVPVLQVQSLALVGALLAMACTMGAIAMGQDKAILAANSTALISVVVIGVPAIEAWGAAGAAVATIIGDSAMAVCYLVLLRRSRTGVRLDLRHFWKPALAAGLGVFTGFASGAGDLGATTLGLGVFVAVVVVTRAIPAEVLDAIRHR